MRAYQLPLFTTSHPFGRPLTRKVPAGITAGAPMRIRFAVMELAAQKVWAILDMLPDRPQVVAQHPSSAVMHLRAQALNSQWDRTVRRLLTSVWADVVTYWQDRARLQIPHLKPAETSRAQVVEIAPVVALTPVNVCVALDKATVRRARQKAERVWDRLVRSAARFYRAGHHLTDPDKARVLEGRLLEVCTVCESPDGRWWLDLEPASLTESRPKGLCGEAAVRAIYDRYFRWDKAGQVR